MVFSDVTASSGISYAGPSWSVAWADTNGDTLPDFFIGNHGAPHNLFLNGGNGRFKEVPGPAFERPLSDAHGAAWADFDNDGDQDLLELVGAALGSTEKTNHLFVNENGVFRDRAVERGIDDPLGRGRRPVWFDWDGDGLLDALVLNDVRANAPSLLFRNNYGFFENTGALGKIGFTKYPLLGSFALGKTHVVISGQPFPQRVFHASQVSPLPMTDLRRALGIPLQRGHVMDAALFDANGDGIDDILEVKGVMPSDVTMVGGKLLSHIQIDAGGGSKGFGFKAADPIDVMVAPRGEVWWTPSIVYIGRGGAHPIGIPFKLRSSDPSVQGLSTAKGEKGVYIGFDRDVGKWQVRVVATAYQEANFSIAASGLGGLDTHGFERFAPSSAPTLLVSAGHHFTDSSYPAGFSDPSTVSNCFSVVAADFDNDGDEDVFAACSGPLAKQGVSNQLFRNTAGKFALVVSAGGVSRKEAGVADGVAVADFDRDGFLDLALTNGQGIWPFNVGPTQIFRNVSRQAGNANHWIEIDLRGMRSNRDGVGARVTLTAGGKKQSRMQRNGVHNGAQDFGRIHFGLGSSTTVQTLEIRWPGGTRQTLSNVPAGQLLRIVEGQN